MRLSAPLVASVALAGLAVVVEIPAPVPWEELFVPLREANISLVIAAAILGALGVSQLRSPWSTTGIAIATLGFATVIAAAVATHWFRMELRAELFGGGDFGRAWRPEVDTLARLDAQIRWWTQAGAIGAVASVAGIGVISRRLAIAGIAVAVAAVGGVLAVIYATMSDGTMGDALTAPRTLHATWLVGLAIAIPIAGAPSPMLASDGFRRAGRGLWLRAIVVAITLGVSLGGAPSDGPAHEAFHAIRLAVTVATIIAFVVFAWGVVDGARLDEPAGARWFLVIAGALLAIAAGALVSVLPAIYVERDIAIPHFDDAEIAVQGTGFVAAMIGLALIVRHHGLHEIRGGAGFRIGVVVVLIAITLAALSVPTDVTNLAPRTVLREIALVAVSVIVARECTNIAHRLTRVPEMPTAKLL